MALDPTRPRSPSPHLTSPDFKPAETQSKEKKDLEAKVNSLMTCSGCTKLIWDRFWGTVIPKSFKKGNSLPSSESPEEKSIEERKSDLNKIWQRQHQDGRPPSKKED